MRFVETPAHLYPAALVADGDGGDAPEFVLPDDLTALAAGFAEDGTLAGGALGDLLTEALAAFDAVMDSTPATPEESAARLAALTDLADAVDAIRAEGTSRVEAATAEAETLAALGDRVHPTASDEGDESGGEGGDDDDEGGDGGGDEPAGGDDAEGAEAREPVTAAGPARRRIPLGRVRDRAPEGSTDVDEATPAVTIVAASDVPGLATGATIEDTGRLARAMHDRVRSMRDGNSAVVATIGMDRDGVPWLEEGASKDDHREAMEAAREGADSIIAAGGWCSPSARTYEFFGSESASVGMLDLPTVGIERGGLEFPISPSIADVWDAPWVWTEADDEAAAGNPHEDPDDDRVKPCFRIPCSDWDEERLRANGICITHGNLSDRAWPEQTRRYVDLVMAAHAHLLNSRRIARVVAESTAVTIGATAGAVAPLLAAIDLQAMDVRDKYRLDESTVLEAVFPMWTPGVIRADLARRSGISIEEVPTSRIVGWFAERGIRPQFVTDWQSLSNTGGSGDGFRETWPTSLLFLIYQAGTHVLGTGGEIDLGVVRDSRLNETNDHTAAWTEEFDLVAKVGHESRVVTVPIVPNGVTSAPATAPTSPLA